MKMFLDYIPLLTVVLTAILGYFFNKTLDNEKEKRLKKREVYESFLNSITLLLFEDGIQLLIDPTQDYVTTEVNNIKLQAIKEYEKIKLWGSQGVIEACFDLFQRNIESGEREISQEVMKEPYFRLIYEMRKDLGMKTNFKVDTETIQIIKFERLDLFSSPR